MGMVDWVSEACQELLAGGRLEAWMAWTCCQEEDLRSPPGGARSEGEGGVEKEGIGEEIG
jgi:hypothetical protein